MFWVMCGYRIKNMLRSKTLLFWSLLFPILLGTLFQLAFGNLMEDNEVFKEIPIAVVEGEGVGENPSFMAVLEEVAKGGEDSLFDVSRLQEEEAKERLRDGEIEGYVLVGTEVRMVVNGTGVHESVLKGFLDQYKRVEKTIEGVLRDHPENLEEVMGRLEENVAFTRETSFDEGSLDTMVGYFYALLAMVCIYGSFWGVENALHMRANLSSLGARRSVAPASKLAMIAADGLAAFLIHMVEIVIVFSYLKFLLGVDFGDKTGYILLACAVGSVIGISLGCFLGVAVKGNPSLKESVTVGVCMVLSFLGGLMVVEIKQVIENRIPLLNRVNPCSLLGDALYSLNIYEGMGRYYRNLAIMLGMACVLSAVSVYLLRRERYASL